MYFIAGTIRLVLSFFRRSIDHREGFARKLPAGATVNFQIHYTPSGEEKMERLKMGIHFAEQTPKYEVATQAIADLRLNSPP